MKPTAAQFCVARMKTRVVTTIAIGQCKKNEKLLKSPISRVPYQLLFPAGGPWWPASTSTSARPGSAPTGRPPCRLCSDPRGPGARSCSPPVGHRGAAIGLWAPFQRANHVSPASRSCALCRTCRATARSGLVCVAAAYAQTCRTKKETLTLDTVQPTKSAVKEARLTSSFPGSVGPSVAPRPRRCCPLCNTPPTTSARRRARPGPAQHQGPRPWQGEAPLRLDPASTQRSITCKAAPGLPSSHY